MSDDHKRKSSCEEPNNKCPRRSINSDGNTITDTVLGTSSNRHLSLSRNQPTESSLPNTGTDELKSDQTIRNKNDLLEAFSRWESFLGNIEKFCDNYGTKALSDCSLEGSLYESLDSAKEALSNVITSCKGFGLGPYRKDDLLWEGQHRHQQLISEAADAVDRKWANVMRIIEGKALGSFDIRLKTLNDFRSSLDRLASAMDDWLKLPITKPDSERLSEILKIETDLGTGELHFVNRFESAKKLFVIQLESYVRRTKNCSNAGADLIFPLMDSLFGMGKTTFSKNYLALIDKMSSELIETVVEYPQEFVGGFLAELKRARTLHITFQTGSLFDARTRTKTLVQYVVDEMRKSWGVIVTSKPTHLWEIFNMIPKPVFIVFDEIGNAFASPEGDAASERTAFYDFTSKVCIDLTRADGIHYLLCGRADFMWDVGVRREDDLLGGLRNRTLVSPGRFQRVNLNPIRESKIRELLEHTVSCNETLASKVCRIYPNLELQEIINMLYVKTAGHPRSLLHRLKTDSPLSDMDDSSLLLNDVKLAVRRFPKAVYQLFSARDKPMDLTALIASSECRATCEYIATRIHAGFGDNIKWTQIYIPPNVEEYLICHFLPLMDFLVAYDKLLDKRHISRTDLFEEFVAKWFISTFIDGNKTCGDILGAFCPPNSALFQTAWDLKSVKIKEGRKVLSSVNSMTDSTISATDLANKFCNYLTRGKSSIYFPAPLSASPDLFVLPHCGEDKLIIGIQAKCYSNQDARISKGMILKEMQKLNHVLSRVRKNYAKPVNGVLMMFATCSYTARDFGEFHNGAKSFVWSDETARQLGIEVLIINLSNPDLRREFIGIALDAPSGDRGAEILERIIQYSSRQPEENVQDATPRSSSSG